MTYLFVTAAPKVTLKRPHAWSPSSRIRPAASGAFCGRGTHVQEVQFAPSFVRQWRTVTYELCLSLLILFRMIGVIIWCTRYWQRDPCPIGWFLCFTACPTLSTLRSWSSTTTLTWAGTPFKPIRLSTGRYSSVSNEKRVIWTRAEISHAMFKTIFV